MKIYDIAQEVFSCKVFPGDPAPEKTIVLKIKDGKVCNLSSFSMCSHNGTHVDAPLHFVDDAKSIDEVSLEKFIGMAYVAPFDGLIGKGDIEEILTKAEKCGNGSEKRILIKGNAALSLEAARVLIERDVWLWGNESQTVGPEDDNETVWTIHREVLKNEMVLLEGIRLNEVSEGTYLLNSAPLNLGGLEGAPCRAILIDLDK